MRVLTIDNSYSLHVGY